MPANAFLRPLRAGAVLAVSTVLLPACAVELPPAFAAMRGPETPAVLAALQGHIAIAQGDMPCNPLRSISNPDVSRCPPYVHQRGFEYQGGIVAEGSRSLLMLQMTRGTTPRDLSTATLIRSRCAVEGAACKPGQKAIAPRPATS